jgi:hypothetical protein
MKTPVAAYLLDSSGCRAPPLEAPSHCRDRRSSRRNEEYSTLVLSSDLLDQQWEKAKDGCGVTESKHARKKTEQRA